MKNLRTFESNDERSEMIAQLCEMGYDQATCDAMSYEELCDCMEKELSKEYEEGSYEDAYESKEEVVEEGVLGALGIRKMSERVDDRLGFDGDEFNPTKDFKVYLRHAEESGSIPSTDMSVIEEALRKARKIGYGLSFWKDDADLSKMQGSEEEKKIANYFIKRAVHSIHYTSSASGHEFGKKPNISALRDSVSNSNLKHLKSFESFSNVRK